MSEPLGDTCDDKSSSAPLLTPSLKICLLGYRSHPFSGGQGIYLKYLSRALVNAGHQVDVISGQPYPHLDETVTLIKLPGLNLYEHGLRSLRLKHLTSLTNLVEWVGKLTGAFSEPYCFGRRVSKYLKRHGRHYDIIHDNQCLSWGILQLQKKQFPLVTTIHHSITNDFEIALNAAKDSGERALVTRWYSFLKMQEKVIKQLDHVVTVSEQSKTDIVSAFNLSEHSLRVIYNGIDTQEFKPLPKVSKIRYRIMVTASADAPLKGLRYLLEAVAALKDQHPKLEVLIVGKPKAGGVTERLIDRLGIKEHLIWVSGISTEQLVRYYAEAEIAVIPSIYEGFGLPAGEAMACGVPVISTQGGALPEVVGDAGILVPVKDSVAIAQALKELLNNEVKRKHFAQIGRQRIEGMFSWDRVAVQMADYYHSVIHANR